MDPVYNVQWCMVMGQFATNFHAIMAVILLFLWEGRPNSMPLYIECPPTSPPSGDTNESLLETLEKNSG